MSFHLRQWDVVKVRIYPDRGIDIHPAVVISVDEMCSDERQLRLNVLFGTEKLPEAMKASALHQDVGQILLAA